MNIFKFGGASLKDAKQIRNVGQIIKSHAHENLLVVVSAMGKTTDALEQITTLSLANKNIKKELDEIRHYHLLQTVELQMPEIQAELEKICDQIEVTANQQGDADLVYDQIVSQGEILSSLIISTYLNKEGISATWVDARNYIKTDSTFREGKILWDETEKLIRPLAKNSKKNIIVTQGFIGSDANNLTTTLGREGSDFSAAIFGFCLTARAVTIWKDVPGVMTADPKRRLDSIVFEELPYKEAAEMTYYGASVIHPKTIKPLANRGIPLYVKSFLDPSLSGTKIHECHVNKLPPLIVHKDNQCLISCKVTDYTFLDETQLGAIFKSLNENNVRINVMQNSAISFSFCVDYRENKILRLIESLSKNFEVYYNANLTLITIKNYDQKTSTEFRNQKGLILEQSSRSTLQVLVKN